MCHGGGPKKTKKKKFKFLFVILYLIWKWTQMSLNVRPKATKLLEGYGGKTLWHWICNDFLNMTSKALSIKQPKADTLAASDFCLWGSACQQELFFAQWEWAPAAVCASVRMGGFIHVLSPVLTAQWKNASEQHLFPQVSEVTEIIPSQHCKVRVSWHFLALFGFVCLSRFGFWQQKPIPAHWIKEVV